MAWTWFAESAPAEGSPGEPGLRKGQQAPAVVLVDVGPRECRMREELQVLFCGMTRATVRLEVVAAAKQSVLGARLSAAN
jgi:hypothetical protein